MNPKEYLTIKSCRKCGRLYQTMVDVSLCPNCYKQNEAKFKVVKTYIREHPSAQLYMIAGDCDVNERQILTWIREERLMVKSDSGILIECLQCGVPIKTGRYCQSCKTRMMTDLRSVYNDPIITETSQKFLKEHKMRFLNKDNRK